MENSVLGMSWKATFSLGLSNSEHRSLLKLSEFSNFFKKGGFKFSDHDKTLHRWYYNSTLLFIRSGSASSSAWKNIIIFTSTLSLQQAIGYFRERCPSITFCWNRKLKISPCKGKKIANMSQNDFYHLISILLYKKVPILFQQYLPDSSIKYSWEQKLESYLETLM